VFTQRFSEQVYNKVEKQHIITAVSLAEIVSISIAVSPYNVVVQKRLHELEISFEVAHKDNRDNLIVCIQAREESNLTANSLELKKSL